MREWSDSDVEDLFSFGYEILNLSPAVRSRGRKLFQEWLAAHDRETLAKAAILIRGYGYEDAAKMVEEL